jgi:hypothetical protein
LQYQAVRAEFEATAWLPRLAHDGLAADSGGNLFQYTGALRGCIDLLAAVDATFALGPCAGAEAGATLGRGSNLAISHTRQVFWAAGLVGLSVRYLGAAPLWVGLLGELGRPLHRPAWRGEDFGTVFQPKPLIGRIGLGVGWLFP